ncbi:MAG: hypothetical protein DSY91_00380 [Deltaproteobacteria bacterium]|nr:MAG: hypothetical protein DSY91_00380 [Deltaproteobacteria bacterium]
MRNLSKGIKTAIVFILVLGVGSALGLTFLFPVRLTKTWIETLPVSARISIARVSFNPLMHLNIDSLSVKPEGNNPVFTGIFFKQVLMRPLWRDMVIGTRAAVIETPVDGAVVYVSVREKAGNRLHVTVSMPRFANLPGPMAFKKGFQLQGKWRLKADLIVATRSERGALSGAMVLNAKNLRLKWETSPLGGRMNLMFLTAQAKGKVDRSVFDFNEIVLRGNELDVDGGITLWLDPITQELRMKGTLFLRPKAALQASSNALDAAIRMLPRETRGFRLAF